MKRQTGGENAHEAVGKRGSRRDCQPMERAKNGSNAPEAARASRFAVLHD